MIRTGRECGWVAATLLITIASAAGQQVSADKPLMVEDVFKNVQELKGIPVDEFMDTIGGARPELHGLPHGGEHAGLEQIRGRHTAKTDGPQHDPARLIKRSLEGGG